MVEIGNLKGEKSEIKVLKIQKNTFYNEEKKKLLHEKLLSIINNLCLHVYIFYKPVNKKN